MSTSLHVGMLIDHTTAWRLFERVVPSDAARCALISLGSLGTRKVTSSTYDLEKEHTELHLESFEGRPTLNGYSTALSKQEEDRTAAELLRLGFFEVPWNVKTFTPVPWELKP